MKASKKQVKRKEEREASDFRRGRVIGVAELRKREEFAKEQAFIKALGNLTLEIFTFRIKLKGKEGV